MTASGRPRRVVVTGGAGFIGANLVRALVARGDDVVVVDDGSAGDVAYLEGVPVRTIQADVARPEGLADALDGTDAIVHLAAHTSVPASVTAPMHDLQRNAVATLALLEAARQARVGRFVLASSTAVLGPLEVAASETLLPRPVSPYGASKLAGEAYLSVYHASHGMTTTAIRIANAYGPFSAHKGSVVPVFVRAALAGDEVIVYGDGQQTRDFVHVDDVCAAFIAVLGSPPGSVGGEVFQIGSGTETGINDLIAALGALTGRKLAVHRAPPRSGDVLRSRSDIGKARAVLGYRPSVMLPDGLERTVSWFQTALTDERLAGLFGRAGPTD